MKRIMLIVLLFGLILFSACGKSEDAEQEPVDNDQTEDVTEEENESEADDETSKDSEQTEEESRDDSDTEPADESNDKDESTEKDNDAKNPETEIIKNGSYSGQADPHTIEIETDDGFVAYQLTMEARDLVVDLEPGDKVTYTYYKDGEMLVIKHIEKVD